VSDPIHHHVSDLLVLNQAEKFLCWNARRPTTRRNSMPDENKVKVNPRLQEILDEDVRVHNELVRLAVDPGGDTADQVPLILAIGLSAIHSRLGEMWRWDKAVDPS